MTDFRFVARLDKSYGEHAGKPAIIPLDSGHHKNVKLTLAKPTFHRTHDSRSNMIIENEKDPWSTYKLFMHYIKVAHPPGWKGLVFLYQAPKKVIAARKSGSKHLGWTDLVKDRAQEKFDPVTGMRPGGKLGSNFANSNTKELAARCKFPEDGNFAGRTARRTGISKVANSGVPQALADDFGRHKNSITNYKYQEMSNKSNLTASTACWYIPLDDEDEQPKEKSRKFVV